MQELDLHDMWFQQDGSTCHTAHLTMYSVNILFHVRDRSIGCLDFLCIYVKAHVYTDKSASIDALEDNIAAFIREIPAEMLESVGQNWTKRMDPLKRSQHLNEIIFKH